MLPFEFKFVLTRIKTKTAFCEPLFSINSLSAKLRVAQNIRNIELQKSKTLSVKLLSFFKNVSLKPFYSVT